MSTIIATEDASLWWSCGGMSGLHGAQLHTVATAQPFHQNQTVGLKMALMSFSKRRLQWSKELHDKFVSAVNQLGGASLATPKSIWNIMQVEGLTLFHIKSHLQKYRLGKMAKRLSTTDSLPADSPRNVEGEAQKYGSHYQRVVSHTSVKILEMTDNPPPLATVQFDQNIVSNQNPPCLPLVSQIPASGNRGDYGFMMDGVMAMDATAQANNNVYSYCRI